MKLGIFLPNWIGDVVMATPTLRALRNHFGPDARMVGIMRPYVADVLVGTPWLDDRIFFNPRSPDPELSGWRFGRRLRRERFDIAVLLTNSLRTAFWAWTSGAPQRVGYARDMRSWFLTDTLCAPMAAGDYLPQPTLDAYLKIAYTLGCPAEAPRIELATTPADERAADEVWRRLGIADDRAVVIFNSGAAFGASKLWPTEYFADLARRIALDWGHTVLVICGPREREIASQITTLAAHAQVVSLADPRLGNDFPLPIGLSKACVRRAALMVTTDSGPRHFAAAFDVPVITLFGPTHVSLSETHFAKAIHLQRHVPCGPCMQTVCPLGHHQCMRDLSVDEVYQAVQSQLVTQQEALAPTILPIDGWPGGGPAHELSSTRRLSSGWQGEAAVATLDGGSNAAVTLATEPDNRSEKTDIPTAGSDRRIGADVLALSRPSADKAFVWVDDRYQTALARAKLDSFANIMATSDGRLLRALPDRENWRLEIREGHLPARGMFLKKHHVRSIGNWLRAKLHSMPTTPGRVEAENVARLDRAGVPVMSVVAFGERLHATGLLESFVISEELAGYTQLDHFLPKRFASLNAAATGGARRQREFDALLTRVAEVAGRFHRQGYNHRDLYCCHFFVREHACGEFDLRLIDLQRVQHRTRLRRRWIVKDLAQLAYSAPRQCVSRSRKLAFFRAYLGVSKLRPSDKRLARSVLRKQWLMELKLGPNS